MRYINSINFSQFCWIARDDCTKIY